MAPDEGPTIVIPRLELQTMRVAVLSRSPMYFKNNWRGAGIFTDKTAAELEEGGKKKMSPMQEALASLHLDDEGHICHTVDAMKAAMCHAIGQVKGLTKLNSSGLFFVHGSDSSGELVRIYGMPELKSQVGKNAMKKPIPMHRIRIIDWAAVFDVEFAADLISADNVANLVSLAGYCAGWGDKRVAGKEVRHLCGGQWRVLRDGDKARLEQYKGLMALDKIKVVGEVGKRKVTNGRTVLLRG